MYYRSILYRNFLGSRVRFPILHIFVFHFCSIADGFARESAVLQSVRFSQLPIVSVLPGGFALESAVICTYLGLSQMSAWPVGIMPSRHRHHCAGVAGPQRKLPLQMRQPVELPAWKRTQGLPIELWLLLLTERGGAA